MKIFGHFLPRVFRPTTVQRSAPLRRTWAGRAATFALAGIAAVLPLSLTAQAQTTADLTVLHSFDGDAHGFFPASPLVEGKDGNFYGTTRGGGSSPSTLYRITPAGAVTLLRTFGAASTIFEYSALLAASDGNIYGTTVSDGANGYGTIFRITPAGAFKVLRDFTYDDGYQGYGALLEGSDGNFYGTNYFGGANQFGTVYKITPVGVLTVLVSFAYNIDSAFSPTSGLVQDSNGNFYCVTAAGLYATPGAVVEITPTGTYTLLYDVPNDNTVGTKIQGSLTKGVDGNFYGITSASYNGVYGSFGSVFQVNPFGAFNPLYQFTGGSDGSDPIGVLAQGQDGNFYGTTRGTDLAGGDHSLGTVFQITSSGTLTTLHTFAGNDGEGANGLVQGSDGNLYGTNPYGGANNGGTVYKLTVTNHPAFFTGQVSLGDGVYYLAFANGNYFGYYTFLSEPNFSYHYDLGYEYVFDADDGNSGVYLYDFASKTFFYTSPTFPFPYLYDFSLNTVLYYYPDPNNAGHYSSNPRYFYDFAAGKIITK